MHKPLLIAGLALCLAGSALNASAQDAPRNVDLAGMDRAIKPGDDFFRFANGGWLKTAEIPPDRSNWGLSPMLAEEGSRRIRELIQTAAAAKAAAGSDERLVGDFYAAYMDEAGIEARGLAPLDGRLKAIAAVADRKGLSEAIGRTVMSDVDPLNATNFHTQHLLGLWVAQDFNQPDRNAPYLLQGGLGMPDRDYYLDPSPRMAALRDKYQAHIGAMLKLAGVADADARAARVFQLERKIAQAHASRAESEDALKGNNPWARADFGKRAPGMDWDAFFKATGLAGQARFIVWQPGAVTGMAALVGSEPLDDWRAYLTFQALDEYAGVLPKAFSDERFAFYGTALAGTPQQQERWKRAVAATNTALGDAVGRMYVAKYFPPAAKTEVEQMVGNIKAAFGRRIDTLEWMTPNTRAEAKAKLKTLEVGVGYPDTWTDYAGLKVGPGDALANVQEAERLKLKHDLAKLGAKVDRREWWMTAQLVNAVNLPIQNAMNFPAAILQPTYFDPLADPAVNYGAIGGVIGHEISHSFDDQGAQFDSTGKLRNWWTPDDLSHFKAAADKLVAQYSAYQPFPDLKVNGELTLGENIADVAGLAAAYDAYRLSLGGKPAPVMGGLTGDQRFFISYAQAWRRMRREASLRQLLLTDGHAPDEYRADSVRNMDAWYAAFDVKPGDKLYLAPAERVRVW